MDELAMDELLKAKDIAEILNLKLSTVYELTRQKAIPHIVLAKRRRRSLVRYRRADIEKLILERSIPTIAREC